MLKASVLIVGDDPHLLRMQTELLGDYQVVTACSREAREAIWTYAFDLLIVSQTVPETSARSLLAQASKLQPQPKTLLICRQYREWHLGSAAFYTVTSTHPFEFQTAVARLLACDQSQALEIARLRKMVS
jgi:DNA-binding NtrC family response regulator